MNHKLALNKFSCQQSNIQKSIHNMKCKCLPKENRKENKELLKLIQQIKRGL